MKPTALLLAAVLASPAQAFIASNGLGVEPSGSGGFTVPWHGQGGATDFWCAAGDFVIFGLGQSPTTPIYRVSETPRRSGEGMRFSLSPDTAIAPIGIAMLMVTKGQGLSAAMAQSFCEIRHKGKLR